MQHTKCSSDHWATMLLTVSNPLTTDLMRGAVCSQVSKGELCQAVRLIATNNQRPFRGPPHQVAPHSWDVIESVT